MNKMLLTADKLDEFVAHTDALGGPGNPECDRYWGGFSYQPAYLVDQSLDPFGEPYVEQQIALYREISGRPFDQSANEHTPLDIALHAAAANPYNHPSPAELALHIERLARVVRFGAPSRGSRMLDMGCGWGLSSEIASYCGLKVTAVDINPDFVELVNRRASRLDNTITACQSAFDTFKTDERYALILFYECFHHALRPWALMANMAQLLEVNGRIVLAGEPVNAIWWKNWGLRLDPLSIYCIRKFGWFESGWSSEFLSACFARAGLAVKFFDHTDPNVNSTIVGSRVILGQYSATTIGQSWQYSGWIAEAGFLTSLGDSELALPIPDKAKSVSIAFRNFRQKPLRVRLFDGDHQIVDRILDTGPSTIDFDASLANRLIRLQSDTWVPDEEIGNNDVRRIAVHLEGVTFA